MNTILLPIDISMQRDRFPAIDVALGLAQDSDTKLVLTHITFDIPVEHIPYELRESAAARVDFEALQSLKEIGRRHQLPETCEYIVREGHPARQIVRLADEIGVNLIVMESHNPGFADYLLGSVSAVVVRHAHCSVYVVRNTE